MNILVVDDDEINQTILKIILEKEGHHVLLANNGSEALKMMIENRDYIHALATDFNMPLMNGDELVREIIRRDIHLQEILILSGLPENEEFIKDLMITHSHIHFLAKPYLFSSILSFFTSPT